MNVIVRLCRAVYKNGVVWGTCKEKSQQKLKTVAGQMHAYERNSKRKAKGVKIEDLALQSMGKPESK